MGCTIRALDALLDDGFQIAGSLHGGFHHAFYERGISKHVFNDIAIAAGERGFSIEVELLSLKLKLKLKVKLKVKLKLKVNIEGEVKLNIEVEVESNLVELL